MNKKSEVLNITLGEALQLKKRLGQEIADAVAFRQENSWVNIKLSGGQPGWSTLNNTVEEAVYRYNVISEMIMLSNCANNIKLNNGEITLTAAILMLDVARKEIASLTKIIKDPNKESNMYIRKTVDDVVYSPTFVRDMVTEKITEMKDLRDLLSKKLAKANWTIEINIKF